MNNSERLFSHPKRLSIINAAILLLAVAGNAYFQGFCRPTLWAGAVIAVCFAVAALSPVLTTSKIRANKVEKWEGVVHFLCGVSFMLFLYCLIFLNVLVFAWWLLAFYYGSGLLLLVPPYFLLILGLSGVVHPVSYRARRYFLAGVAASMVIPVASIVLYREALQDMEDFGRSNYTELRPTYMTEKILGMGILYHVEYCPYDGWRPPLHEPMLNIGYWAHGLHDPLDVTIEQRLRLYKRFFPDRPVKLACSCAWEERAWYHGDELWRK